MSKVAAAFESMDYGPAPESPAPADAFLDAHNRRFGVFINNTWAFPPGRAMAASVDPCTGAKLAESVEGTREDVDAAVAAAAGALPAWKALPGHARARYVTKRPYL
ncbi:hypothetical protein T484DRAFT_1841500 [Baffinella frigidus]|nr:hypothetical protein T484DRAFT_1841500 [Cryptophyta sp. CCMP2293]